MSKHFSYIALTCTAVIALFASCNNEEETACEPLSAPDVTIDRMTPDSIFCSWEAIKGARQYGYRVTDKNGVEVEADVTTATSLKIGGLEHVTDYTIHFKAFPQKDDFLESDYTTLSTRTPLWERVDKAEGKYTSGILSQEPYKVTLDEDRTADDYKGDGYGVFTLDQFFNRTGGKIVFTVNPDHTITILNANNPDRESGELAEVKTGWTKPKGREVVFINERSAKFERGKKRLTFKAKLANGTLQLETFKW